MRQDLVMAGSGKKRADIDREVDRLFELPPEEFTAARDDLAKRAQAGGATEESRAIKGMKRPTVAAWAVNQVARRRPKEVAELLDAGDALQRAQRKVLSGVRSSDFRESSERRRSVVARLVRAAEEVLKEAGRGPAGATEAVRSTFEAASLDDRAGEVVRAGRLSKELPPPASFGAVEGLGLVPAPPDEPGPTRRSRAQRVSDKKVEASALKAQRVEAAREAKELSETAATARRQAIKAREQAGRAEAKAERLRFQAEQARTSARDAIKQAQSAEADAIRAQDAADRAAKRVERLEAQMSGA
jgi:hypothetical protein